jgi:hypothetical protein
MRYYLDTEFIEDGRTIDLISIGIVAEDGRTLYYGNKECDFTKASDWVIDNVLKPLGFERMPKAGWVEGRMQPLLVAPFWQSRQYIKEQLLFFFAGGDVNSEEDQIVDAEHYKTVEVWADYGSYDWVALCQLFGTMMDLPEGMPMYVHDLQQELHRLGIDESELPKQESGQHDALADAQWLRLVHSAVRRQEYKRFYCS